MKTTGFKLFLTTILTLFTVFAGIAQEQPIRVGVKIGFPNIIGGHLEYVTPLLGERLAPSLEYSSVKLDGYLEPDQGGIKYWEAGFNYYFGKKPGRGSYVHLGYGNLRGDFIFEDYAFNNANEPGQGTASIDQGSFNIRLGAKAGGLFYFRPEIGYTFSPLSETIAVSVDYPNGQNEVRQEEMPGLLTSGFTINIGIGFAF
ncbi:hypothetical protein FGM00_16525 [Aggregatimonas sangjinii]|uniref:DUF3575 domain-containing protein n=1 Tax=Aggregatimonas sangjinii TaxID=2583587 RepID=A0A5B7SSX9_9FLAO|nr:hypothetical protein [Aggregatimonas sangjinii]QCX01637.1 hypothetical protein FGM00_16525 [Aggregatimonas sangjinii]